MFFGKKDKEKKSNSDIDAVVLGLAKNGIAVELNSVKALKADGSRIGGMPYVPKDFVWPTYTGEDYDGEVRERPLAFLCQINLAEVTGEDTENCLPERGMLYFFYECETMRWGFDPEDSGCARVFWYEDIADFAEMNFPEALADEYRFAAKAISFSRQKSYPSFEELDLHAKLDCDWDAYDEALARLGCEEDCERHKLLGYADLVQGEMLTECERISRGMYCGDAESYQNTSEEVKREVEKAAAEWILLFQLSSVEEDGCEMMWGDCGNLYFYIRKSDLQKRDFDRVWMVLQCG